MDGIECVHLEEPAPHARLIGGYHDTITPLVEAGDGVQAAGTGLPLLGRLDVVVGIEVDDALEMAEQTEV